MTTPLTIRFTAMNLDDLPARQGRIVLLQDDQTGPSAAARRVNRLCKGAVVRAIESDAFTKAKPGEIITISWPAGLVADAVDIIKLPRRADQALARKAGAALAVKLGEAGATVLAAGHSAAMQLAMGAGLRCYEFAHRKTKGAKTIGALDLMVNDPDKAETGFAPMRAVIEGVTMTRDLVSEPANVLTTTEFASRIELLRDLGLQVEILDEDEMRSLGMGALLCVGQGSASPSKIAIMQWKGGAADQAPLALIGKGVVFDTGGISLKPAAGMEDMTMDMGGAAVVTGVMSALAQRKAAANVVGLVGLVENMPSGTATRPGDIVTSMKGDTIEVINTDAEGRLVLCDVMWYAQDRFKPAAMIDLATLTGAMIIALGNETAGIFSNNDTFAGQFLRAADTEGEAAWRLPLGDDYDAMLKSQKADMKNVGGRAAGSITAAQFLGRFVNDGTPWIHIDIAGVAQRTAAAGVYPKGATGWGVMALDRLVAQMFEQG